MTAPDASLKQLARFVEASPDALVQLLVAAAGKATYARIQDCPTYPTPVHTTDLPENLRLLREVLCFSHPAHSLAGLYVAAHTLQEQKRTGRFFTPVAVADWGLSKAPLRSGDAILDAGSGTGAFAAAILALELPIRSYVGIENDPILVLCAAHVLEALRAPASFRLCYANFFAVSAKGLQERGLDLPDVVVSNPPFVRFHNLRGQSHVLADLGVSMGISLSALSGASNYFVCKAAELTNAGGPPERGSGKGARLVFFLPREAAGAAYSRRLRADLQSTQGWHATKEEIPRYLTEVEGLRGNALALMFVFERKDSAVAEVREKRVRRPVVGDLLQVSRGIATGRNSFFVMSEEDARRREIPSRYLRRVLPTRVSLPETRLTPTDWKAFRKAGLPCWLLTLPPVEMKDLELSVRAYLKDGLREGLHVTATGRRLRYWYSLPIPARPPDVFVTYLFRGKPRFLLNYARLLHLTNILGGRVRLGLSSQVEGEMLVDSLNRRAKSWIEEQKAGREYRDGLRKIEPKELEALPIDADLLTILGQDAAKREAVNRALFE